jgi:predicted MFS family arabinose efflux permease
VSEAVLSAQPAAAARRERALSLALGGMLALASAMGIGRFVYTPILPAMAEALGLTKSAAGLIAAANFLGYLAGALLLALPRLPGSRRAWFLGAIGVGAAAMAGMGLVDAIPAFLLLRFVGGVASACVLVLGSALVLDRLAAAGRSHLAGLHFAGVGLGIAVSAALVDALQAHNAGWRGLWLASAAVAGAALPLCARLVPDGQAALAAAHSAPATAARPARGLAGLNLCHGLFGFGYVVTATFLVAAVRAAPAARTLEAMVWIIVGLAAIPSTTVWGRAGRRFGVLRAYGLACFCAAAGVAVGGAWPAAAGALLASVLLGGTFMGITALGFAAARGLAPQRQRRAFAAMTAAFGVGQASGPVIAGWLMDRTQGFLAPSLLGAAALALAAAIALRTESRLAGPGDGRAR